MDEVNNGEKAWNMVPNNSSSKEGPWKSLGSSMSSISYGFVATAILISMFLIMAVFEHLFRPDVSPSHDHSRSTQMYKFNGPVQPQLVETTSSYASVVMPGEDHPRFIGRPTPPPCAREGVQWPSHLISSISNHSPSFVHN